MPIDLHSNDSTIASGAAFSLADKATGQTGASTCVSNLESGSASWTTPAPANSFRYKALKRALDVLLILAAAPVLAPLLLLIAAAVRISSPGPVFFPHRRIRGHGLFFNLWKFRTMYADSAEAFEDYLSQNPAARTEWLATHALGNDPRITGVGAFLRKTGLNELPQLWNVLNGSMSLVGPRPIVAAEVERYGDGFASYCMVKPGMTGIWRVSGSNLTREARVSLLKRYVHTWSLSGDLLILLKTLFSFTDSTSAY